LPFSGALPHDALLERKIKPQAIRSAIHIASFMSVSRPGTFFRCAALATISSKSPSHRIFQTGIQ